MKQHFRFECRYERLRGLVRSNYFTEVQLTVARQARVITRVIRHTGRQIQQERSQIPKSGKKKKHNEHMVKAGTRLAGNRQPADRDKRKHKEGRLTRARARPTIRTRNAETKLCILFSSGHKIIVSKCEL